jgi:UPF0042 nucleotide-binding protein
MHTPRYTPPPPSRGTANLATRLVVVSGLSGSGKTVAMRTLEDLDYYCVDNLPAELVPEFVASVTRNQPGRFPRLAVGVDVRNRAEDLGQVPAILARLAQQGIEYRLVFLDTRDDVLFKRFSDTRRRHPLSTEGMTLADAIAIERRLLRPLMAIADKVLDTSDLNVHQLRRAIATEFGASSNELSLLFESFAFKHGVPADADFVFDARCLPNPHWDPKLRPLSGRDTPVREYFAQHGEVEAFYTDVLGFLQRWLPRFESEQRSYVTIGVGCTGGRHRSVYLAERLAEAFRATREHVVTFHRELE